MCLSSEHSGTLRILSPPNFELNSLCSQDVEPGWQISQSLMASTTCRGLVATIATSSESWESCWLSNGLTTYGIQMKCHDGNILQGNEVFRYCSFGGLVFTLPFSLSNAHDRCEPSTINGWNVDGPCDKFENWISAQIEINL